MLTKQQQRIYDYLKTELSNGVVPSVREICIATGLSSTSSVHAHLKKLETLGLIKRSEGKNRSIIISGTENTSYVPILGTVTAGVPILAVEEIEGYLPYKGKSGEELFALKVKGESMKDVGIIEGDYVIAKKTPIASNGDIVVALIGDEATVKTFIKQKDKIILRAENQDFEDIIPNNLEILGKVVAQMRYYS